MGIPFVCVAIGKCANMISLGRRFLIFRIVKCCWHVWKCAKLSLIYLHEVQICQVHWRENVGATFPAHHGQWAVLCTKLLPFFPAIGWEFSMNPADMPLGKIKAATKVSGSLFYTFGSRTGAFVISRNFVAFYLREDSKAARTLLCCIVQTERCPWNFQKSNRRGVGLKQGKLGSGNRGSRVVCIHNQAMLQEYPVWHYHFDFIHRSKCCTPAKLQEGVKR